MSKGESALEAAFKEKDVVAVTGGETLTTVPDVITGSGTVDIVVPASAPQEYARVVMVQAGVQVSVNGGTASAGTATSLYIADASSTDVPVILA